MHRFLSRFFSTFALLALLLLAACTGEATVDDTPTAEMTSDTVAETPAEMSETTSDISFTVIGAVETQGEGGVLMFCDDGDGMGQPFIEIGYGAQLGLNLMLDASGTVEVLGSGETEAQPGQANYVDFRSDDGVNYDLGSGQLVIESMPAAEGDMFIGTLTVELSDEDGNTINLEATYNADAGMQSFDDCQ